MEQQPLWSWTGKSRVSRFKAIGKFRSFAVGGVPPEMMGIGPVVAIPKALELAGLAVLGYWTY